VTKVRDDALGIAYHWQNSIDGVTWINVAINGRSASYVLQDTDQNLFVRVQETYTDDTGQSVTLSSAATPKVSGSVGINVAVLALAPAYGGQSRATYMYGADQTVLQLNDSTLLPMHASDAMSSDFATGAALVSYLRQFNVVVIGTTGYGIDPTSALLVASALGDPTLANLGVVTSAWLEQQCMRIFKHSCIS
jgi:hypothetical protein